MYSSGMHVKVYITSMSQKPTPLRDSRAVGGVVSCLKDREDYSVVHTIGVARSAVVRTSK
jgi:hypothetical protein